VSFRLIQFGTLDHNNRITQRKYRLRQFGTLDKHNHMIQRKYVTVL
jgi:hypothetical protein